MLHHCTVTQCTACILLLWSGMLAVKNLTDMLHTIKQSRLMLILKIALAKWPNGEWAGLQLLCFWCVCVCVCVCVCLFLFFFFFTWLVYCITYRGSHKALLYTLCSFCLFLIHEGLLTMYAASHLVVW